MTVMLYYAMALVLIGAGGNSLVVEEQVDMAELSHVYAVENDGFKPQVRETGAYWIFWDWSPSRKRYCVVDWVMVTQGKIVGSTLAVMKNGVLYRIRPIVIRETWRMYDPEQRAKKLDDLDWDRPGLVGFASNR